VWVVPETLPDGAYELIVRTKCRASTSKALPGADSFMSKPVSGLVDRTAPTKFGQGSLPSNNAYFPGNEISIAFSEEIDCSQPYTFVAQLKLSTVPSKILTPTTGLAVLCKFNKLSFDFTSSAGVSVRP
jgi:hypothetical protein